MRIDIVNHAHRYSKCLAYQLSSLILYPPKSIDLTYYLYYAPDDEPCVATIDYFRTKIPCQFVTRPQEAGYVMNRAIGRNEVAQATTADWVWFTDTDYLFREDCLDKLGEVLATRWGCPAHNVDLAYPQRVMITEQPDGDQIIAAMAEPTVKDVDAKLFWSSRMSRAIGGIQIATQAICHKIGYVPWMKRKLTNWNFNSDLRFRRECPIRHAIELRHIYRIRHSTRGYTDPMIQL